MDLAFRNDSVFALSPFSLYVGDNTNFALADPAQWTLDTRLPALATGDYKEIETILSEIYKCRVLCKICHARHSRDSRASFNQHINFVFK